MLLNSFRINTFCISNCDVLAKALASSKKDIQTYFLVHVYWDAGWLHVRTLALRVLSSALNGTDSYVAWSQNCVHTSPLRIRDRLRYVYIISSMSIIPISALVIPIPFVISPWGAFQSANSFRQRKGRGGWELLVKRTPAIRPLYRSSSIFFGTKWNQTYGVPRLYLSTLLSFTPTMLLKQAALCLNKGVVHSPIAKHTIRRPCLPTLVQVILNTSHLKAG